MRECRADPVLARNPRVVVAVSGGPDSTALLHAFTRSARRLGLSISAAHLDHGLRAGSAADARRVADLCRQLEVPLESRRARPRTIDEDASRRLRHAHLEDVAAAAGAETIALGHTADDQAETVLLHLIRGAGLEGLAGMAAREGRRFRPLLGVSRADVEAHCLREGLKPVLDSSNRSRRYTRNRVRLDLIPLLETFNPRVKAALLRLSDSARYEHSVVVEEASRWLGTRSGALDRRDYRALPRAVAAEVLRLSWARALDGGPPPGRSDVLERGRRLVRSDRSAGMLNLGGGLTLTVTDDVFWIGSPGRG